MPTFRRSDRQWQLPPAVDSPRSSGVEQGLSAVAGMFGQRLERLVDERERAKERLDYERGLAEGRATEFRLDPDGNLVIEADQLEMPERPSRYEEGLIRGRVAAYASRLMLDTERRFAELRHEHADDPDAFARNAEAFVRGTAEAMPALLRGAYTDLATQTLSRHVTDAKERYLARERESNRQIIAQALEDRGRQIIQLVAAGKDPTGIIDAAKQLVDNEALFSPAERSAMLRAITAYYPALGHVSRLIASGNEVAIRSAAVDLRAGKPVPWAQGLDVKEVQDIVAALNAGAELVTARRAAAEAAAARRFAQQTSRILEAMGLDPDSGTLLATAKRIAAMGRSATDAGVKSQAYQLATQIHERGMRALREEISLPLANFGSALAAAAAHIMNNDEPLDDGALRDIGITLGQLEAMRPHMKPEQIAELDRLTRQVYDLVRANNKQHASRVEKTLGQVKDALEVGQFSNAASLLANAERAIEALGERATPELRERLETMARNALVVERSAVEDGIIADLNAAKLALENERSEEARQRMSDAYGKFARWTVLTNRIGDERTAADTKLRSALEAAGFSIERLENVRLFWGLQKDLNGVLDKYKPGDAIDDADAATVNSLLAQMAEMGERDPQLYELQRRVAADVRKEIETLRRARPQLELMNAEIERHLARLAEVGITKADPRVQRALNLVTPAEREAALRGIIQDESKRFADLQQSTEMMRRITAALAILEPAAAEEWSNKIARIMEVPDPSERLFALRGLLETVGKAAEHRVDQVELMRQAAVASMGGRAVEHKVEQTYTLLFGNPTPDLSQITAAADDPEFEKRVVVAAMAGDRNLSEVITQLLRAGPDSPSIAVAERMAIALGHVATDQRGLRRLEAMNDDGTALRFATVGMLGPDLRKMLVQSLATRSVTPKGLELAQVDREKVALWIERKAWEWLGLFSGLVPGTGIDRHVLDQMTNAATLLISMLPKNTDPHDVFDAVTTLVLQRTLDGVGAGPSEVTLPASAMVSFGDNPDLVMIPMPTSWSGQVFGKIASGVFGRRMITQNPVERYGLQTVFGAPFPGGVAWTAALANKAVVEWVRTNPTTVATFWPSESRRVRLSLDVGKEPELVDGLPFEPKLGENVFFVPTEQRGVYEVAVKVPMAGALVQGRDGGQVMQPAFLRLRSSSGEPIRVDVGAAFPRAAALQARIGAGVYGEARSFWMGAP